MSYFDRFSGPHWTKSIWSVFTSSLPEILWRKVSWLWRNGKNDWAYRWIVWSIGWIFYWCQFIASTIIGVCRGFLHWIYIDLFKLCIGNFRKDIFINNINWADMNWIEMITEYNEIMFHQEKYNQYTNIFSKIEFLFRNTQ